MGLIEQFAEIYVNILEPLGRAMVVFVVILTVLWVLIVLNDAKKGKDLITKLFEMVWKGLNIFVIFIGLFVWKTFKFVLGVVTVAISALRDFFTSRA